MRITWNSDPQTACATTTGDNACGTSPATLGVAGVLEQRNGAGEEAFVALQRGACSGVQGEQARNCGSKRRIRIPCGSRRS